MDSGLTTVLTTRVLTMVATPDLSGVVGDGFVSTSETRAWQTVDRPARALLSPHETGAEQFRGVPAGWDSPQDWPAMAPRAAPPGQGPRILLPADHRGPAHRVGEVLVRGRTGAHRRPVSAGLGDAGGRAQAGPRPPPHHPRNAPQRRSRHRLLPAV